MKQKDIIKEEYKKGTSMGDVCEMIGMTRYRLRPIWNEIKESTERHCTGCNVKVYKNKIKNKYTNTLLCDNCVKKEYDKSRLINEKKRVKVTKFNKNYVDSKLLYYHLIVSKNKGQCTDELMEMFIQMVENIQRKFWYNKTQDKMDCRAEAIITVVTNYYSYDEDIYPNPFPYITEIIKRALAKGFNDIYPYIDSTSKERKYQCTYSLTGLYEDNSFEM